MKPSLRPAIGAAKSSIWLPSDVPGLVAEFYSEFVIKNGGNLVSQWTDRSGEGNHATQTVATNKPLWVDAQINGYPSIRHDGIDNFLSIDSLATILDGNDTPFTWFGVFKLLGGLGDADALWGVGLSSSSIPFMDFITYDYGDGTKYHLRRRDEGGAALLRASGGTPDTTAWHYAILTFSGTTVSLWVDGVKVIDEAALDGDSLGILDNFALGAATRAGPLSYFNMEYAAKGFYDNAISGPNVTLLNTFLATKYGL